MKQACEAEPDTSEVPPLNTAVLGTKIRTHELLGPHSNHSKANIGFVSPFYERGFSMSYPATLNGCRLAKNPADRQSRLALICTLVNALHLVQHLEKTSHLKVKSLEG